MRRTEIFGTKDESKGRGKTLANAVTTTGGFHCSAEHARRTHLNGARLLGDASCPLDTLATQYYVTAARKTPRWEHRRDKIPWPNELRPRDPPLPPGMHDGKQINSLDDVIHMQESPPHNRILVGCSSPFMRLA